MQPKPGHKPDFLTLVAVTSHLMTCYATKPCPVLARKAADHLRILLETHEEELGPLVGFHEKTVSPVAAACGSVGADGAESRSPRRDPALIIDNFLH